MNISITKTDLLHALSVVSKGMSSHSTLPILSGILLEAEEKALTLQTTDLENSIRCTVPAFIEEPGKTVVPGKLFGDIIKALPDAAIQFTTGGGHLVIRCLESEFTLNTLDAQDFPQFPSISATREVKLPVARLSTMVQQVLKAVSKDEHRMILTGILITVNDKDISLVATDSYRLAVSEVELVSPAAIDFSVIVPGHLFGDIIKATASDDELSIGVADNQIIFSSQDSTYITRKIEGNYPNYKQLIPTDHTLSAIVDTKDLIDTVRRISLLSQSNSSIRLRFSSSDQVIEVSSQTQDVGTASERIKAQIEGEDMEIAFNHRFIIDGLSTIASETTLIELQDFKKPGIFKSMGVDRSLYLAMPVRLG